MSVEEKMRLVVALDEAIRRKTCGSAEEYAAKLHISRRAFFRLIDFMKVEMAAPVEYDKAEHRFKYGYEGKLHFGFVKTTPLDENETKNVNGGVISHIENTIPLHNLFRVPTAGTLGSYV